MDKSVHHRTCVRKEKIPYPLGKRPTHQKVCPPDWPSTGHLPKNWRHYHRRFESPIFCWENDWARHVQGGGNLGLWSKNGRGPSVDQHAGLFLCPVQTKDRVLHREIQAQGVWLRSTRLWLHNRGINGHNTNDPKKPRPHYPTWHHRLPFGCIIRRSRLYRGFGRRTRGGHGGEGGRIGGIIGGGGNNHSCRPNNPLDGGIKTTT